MTHSPVYKAFMQFLRDDSGTSLIEFTIAAPFMIALLLFTIVANDSINASSEIGKVSATVADIISQSATVTKEVIDSTFDVADILVNAQRNTNLELYVTGIEIFADGTTEVIWSRDNGKLATLTKPNPGDTYELPPELLVRTGFIVSSRARLSHTNVLVSSGKGVAGGGNLPFIGSILPGMDSTVYDYENNFVPRASIKTSCGNCSN